ncbi:ArsR family transcriptional regulator [Lentzea sp. NPDC051213]|uniref:ArsR family transcriptional regulator n=1 Tax=Lentzea sp. NPDC051213 TaxID=3364126 RepID=UPI0037B41533
MTFRINRRYLQLMRSNAPALLPVLRSRLQAGILATLLLSPDMELSLTDLAKRVDGSMGGVHNEVERLEQAGILTSRQVGRTRLVRAGASALVEPLTRLIELAFGPQQVVAEEFGGLQGVAEILIYGSWAARLHGEPGAEPRDIDVMVVASTEQSADRADVYAAADRAEKRLAKAVNPTVVSAKRWATQSQDDALLQEISTRPVVKIPLAATENEA